MKISLSVVPGLAGLVFATAACTVTPPTSPATAVSSAPPFAPAGESGQRLFSTPEDAVKALVAATQAHDKPSLLAIFGPASRDLVSGDQVEDAKAAAAFAHAIARLCRLSYVDADKVILNIGAQDWPFPIPLVRKEGQWSFDTAAGVQEIVDRRVGENELVAISVCATYVTAQREYASRDRDGTASPKYAQKLKSTAGRKDGLFWEAAAGEEASPFGPLVASARAEGYGPHPEGSAPEPFYGYTFRILTAQGPHASGGQLNYLVNGDLRGGFALVATPARWGDSGIMTFIVNQQGQVYQSNLGSDTAEEAAAITQFDPDGSWMPVPREGNL
jgi:hypothetical protein